MKRRDLFKSVFAAGVGLVGASALKPLYASDELMAFKGPDVPDVEPVKVSEHCYTIPAMGPHPTPDNFGMFSNPGFVVTDAGVVVVDSGSSLQIGEMVLRQIKKITDKPVVKVINTHFHGDHWLGNHAFVNDNPDVEIIAHTKCVENLKGGQDKFWFDFMQTTTNNKISGTVITLPNKTVEGGEEFEVGGVKFKLHHFGQVHTVSDIAVEVVNDKAFYTGDMVMRRVANMEDGSFRGSIDALGQMAEMDIETFIPMHGTPDDVKLINEGKEFMEIIYSNVEVLYDEGLSDFEMKPIIMDKPFMKDVAAQWPGYEDTIGKFIVVAIKEVEQAMFA